MKKPDLSSVTKAAGSMRRVKAQPELTEQATEAAPPKRVTRQVAGHFDEAVAWQLRELAVEKRTTVQSLLAEALDGLFRAHGKPELAGSGGRRRKHAG